VGPKPKPVGGPEEALKEKNRRKRLSATEVKRKEKKFPKRGVR